MITVMSVNNKPIINRSIFEDKEDHRPLHTTSLNDVLPTRNQLPTCASYTCRPCNTRTTNADNKLCSGSIPRSEPVNRLQHTSESDWNLILLVKHSFWFGISSITSSTIIIFSSPAWIYRCLPTFHPGQWKALYLPCLPPNLNWQVRIATVAFLLCSVVFSSELSEHRSVEYTYNWHDNIPGIQSSHCTLFITLVSSFSSVAFSCTAILFFLRLRAVYNRNQVVVVTFFVLWLVFPALSITLPLLITIRQVYNSTKYCPSGIFNDGIIFIMQLATLVYDTLVFIAISRRLCQISSVKPSGPKENMRLILFGKHLPAFTKSLYRDGQVYYL